ncbi:hypothetical protein Lal_00040076 [Lupinus albus]|nr:hypothetical protein Lal_00040076 [Lupinus albus]
MPLRNRSIGQIVLAMTTYRIAATLLPGGQTAHSRFKITLNPYSTSVCSIIKQSDLAKLITQESTIVLDEVVLLVIPNDNNAKMIAASIVKSLLWAYTYVLHLRQNMCSLQDHNFAENLMRIGNGLLVVILTPTNENVHKLNDIIINHYSGEDHNLLSFDEVKGDTNNLYQEEYLNSITPGGLPPHVLKVR